MKEQLLMIYEPDPDYGRGFSAYLQKKIRRAWRVMTFCRWDEFAAALEEKNPELIIVPPEAGTRPECEGRENILFLSETDTGEANVLYRYASMEKQVSIISRLMNRGEKIRCAGEGSFNTKVWGVYSPMGGSGKSLFALLLGQLLAEENPTLYLNLERFSGFSMLWEQERVGDLSDLLYYVRVQGGAAQRISELEEHFGALCYISPACERGDLRGALREDWESLVGALKETGRYRHLILDIGDGPAEEEWLLALCGRVFMPVRSDPVGRAKEKEWLRVMEEKDRNDILEKTVRLELPPPEALESAEDIRGLRFTSWGRLARELLKEEET